MKKLVFLFPLLLFFNSVDAQISVFYKKKKAGLGINSSGYITEILPAEYDKIDIIQNKYAILVKGKYYYLYTFSTGKMPVQEVDEILFEKLSPYSRESHLFLLRKGTKWSYLDEQYEIAQPWYDSVRVSGSFIYFYKDNKIGLDFRGYNYERLVISPRFSSINYIEPFSGYYIITSVNDSGKKIFYYARRGFNYDEKRDISFFPLTIDELYFPNGQSVLGFRENNKWGFGKITDTELIRLTESYFDSLDKKSSASSAKGFYKGKAIEALAYPSQKSLDWKIDFDDLKQDKDGYIIASRNGKQGLFFKDENLLGVQYDKIDRIKESGLFILKVSKGFQLYDAFKRKFFDSKLYSNITVWSSENFLLMRYQGKEFVYFFQEEKWLTDEGYENISFNGPDYFFLRNQKTVKIFERKQKKIIHTLTADTAYRIHRNLLVSKTGVVFQLLNLDTKASQSYTNIQAWQGHYILSRNKFTDILNVDGRTEEYDEVRVLDACLVLRKNSKTSLLLTSGNYVNLKDREEFYGIVGNCYVVKEGSYKGLLDANGNRLLHCGLERMELNSLPSNAKYPILNLKIPKYSTTFTTADYSPGLITFFNRECDECSGTGSISDVKETKGSPIYSSVPGVYYENGEKKFGTTIIGYTSPVRKTIKNECKRCKGKGALFIQFKWDGYSYIPVS